MTFSEFKEMANESLIVRCRTVQERYNALTLFKAAGIEIRHKIIDRLQIDSQEDDSIYLIQALITVLFPASLTHMFFM